MFESAVTGFGASIIGGSGGATFDELYRMEAKTRGKGWGQTKVLTRRKETVKLPNVIQTAGYNPPGGRITLRE